MRNDNYGIYRLQQRLAKLPKAVKQAAYAETMKAAEELAAKMKALAPVDSGDLRDSIAITPGGQPTPPHSQPGGSHIVPENVVAITAGDTDVRYAHLVEYGTEKSEAQPFFWPAVRLGRKKAAARIKRGMRKAIKETMT